MPSSIGIRVYSIKTNKRGENKSLPLEGRHLNGSISEFLDNFIFEHTNNIVKNNDTERRWYFEPINVDNDNKKTGYIHYGTFGFESNFVDIESNTHNYSRKITDVEEIPLFYEFWCPKDVNFGLAAFQSFQGRSCITHVLTEAKKQFENKNEKYVMNFHKLQINDANNSAYQLAPVRQLRLIKRNTSSDLADKYCNVGSKNSVNIEISISARRKGSLGIFKEMLSSLPNGAESVITHEGIEYPEAIAEIRVGGKTRQVGIFGINADAGVIDITDTIKRGRNGHPTFESLKNETREILQDFYKFLLETRHEN